MTARLAAIGFGILVLFQVALAAGAPLGRAAWGGGHTGALPQQLRVASLVAAAVWVLAGLVLLRRAGHLAGLLPWPVAQWGTWIVAGLLVLGTVMNVASPSGWERYMWGPFAATLAVLCFLTARAPAP